MQESRLFQILYYLLDKGQVTAPELAETFEVSVRTIYRDIDALSGAGVPVYTESGRSGGIRLMKGFVLDRAVLSEEEKREILTALQSINAAQRGNNSRILQKLSAVFQLSSADWLEVDFSRWGNSGTDNQKFELLKSAVIHRNYVKIRYANSCGESSERMIQPLKMAYKSMAWYVKAYCTWKQDYRIFKLTRIMDLELLPERFSNRPAPAPEEVGEGMGQTCRQVVLRFPRHMAYRVYDEFDQAQIQQQQDGDLIVRASMPEDEWLIGFVLSFGTEVEIIEPLSLKRAVADSAKKIYENLHMGKR